MRKDAGFDVTDKIKVEITTPDAIKGAIANFGDYICSQTLTQSLLPSDDLSGEGVTETDIDDNLNVKIRITKI